MAVVCDGLEFRLFLGKCSLVLDGRQLDAFGQLLVDLL